MKVFDISLLCAGTQKVQIFQRIGGKEAKIFDGSYSEIPGSLEDEQIEELSTKDNSLQLYIY